VVNLWPLLHSTNILLLAFLNGSTHSIKLIPSGILDILSCSLTFIGEDVIFDTNYPEDIVIEEGVRLTVGVRIVTHFMNPKTGSYDRGQVHVGKGAYIGMGTMVVKPVTIGEGAIVGAGAIVTKDIPSNEVWAGNPARFIRKR
jgi:acetyltransferase-like isoleucine patch superfamily enzyme